MENWKWDFHSSKKVEQEIAKKLRITKILFTGGRKIETIKNWRIVYEPGKESECCESASQWDSVAEPGESLTDERDFHDLKGSNSSGAPHVPTKPSTIPSRSEKPSRESAMPNDTRNTMGIWETFLKAYLLVKDNPYLASKIPRIWHLPLAKWNKTLEWGEMRRVLQNRTQVKMGFKDLYSTLEEFTLVVLWWINRGIRSWKCIVENSRTLWNFRAGKSNSILKYAPVHRFLT